MTMQFLDDFFNPTPTEDEQEFLCTLFTLTDNDKQEAFAQLYVNDTATFIRLFSNLQENPEQQALFTSLIITDIQSFLATLSVLDIDNPLRIQVIATIANNFGQIEMIAKSIETNQQFLNVLVTLDGYPFKQATVAEIFTTKIETIDSLESLFKALFERNIPTKQLVEIVKLIFNSLRIDKLKTWMPNIEELNKFLKNFETPLPECLQLKNFEISSPKDYVVFQGLPPGYLTFAFFGTKSPIEAVPSRGVNLIEQAAGLHLQ